VSQEGKFRSYDSAMKPSYESLARENEFLGAYPSPKISVVSGLTGLRIALVKYVCLSSAMSATQREVLPNSPVLLPRAS
jgi:hypothetical protein